MHRAVPLSASRRKFHVAQDRQANLATVVSLKPGICSHGPMQLLTTSSAEMLTSARPVYKDQTNTVNCGATPCSDKLSGLCDVVSTKSAVVDWPQLISSTR